MWNLCSFAGSIHSVESNVQLIREFLLWQSYPKTTYLYFFQPLGTWLCLNNQRQQAFQVMLTNATREILQPFTVHQIQTRETRETTNSWRYFFYCSFTQIQVSDISWNIWKASNTRAAREINGLKWFQVMQVLWKKAESLTILPIQCNKSTDRPIDLGICSTAVSLKFKYMIFSANSGYIVRFEQPERLRDLRELNLMPLLKLTRLVQHLLF